MYSEDDLDAAVSSGAISPEAAQALRDFVARRSASPTVDQENFRLLTGFNDIFVTIAVVLILVAVSQLSLNVGGARGAAAAVAAVSWALAEYFTRRRRMALPSIVLLLAFVAGVFAASAAGALHDLYDRPAAWSESMVLAPALTTLAAYAHWRRFRVPLTVAAGTCAALASAAAALFWLVPATREHVRAIMFVAGLAVFALAMGWDASDRERRTRRSDVAFWLHLAAAPLIVHPVFAMLGMLGGGAAADRAGVAVAVYLLLALLALAIDRRALLVSALAYVLYATSTLLSAAGSLADSFAMTALIIGSALLLLSALWHRARGLLMAVLPSSVRERLPVL